MRPSLLIFGIDLKAMASVQDIVMIEDYGLPRYDRNLTRAWPIMP
jgi:hypothetical protein